MSIKQKAFNLSTQLMKKTIQIVGRDKLTAILAQISEDIAPVLTENTEFGAISFFCPGKIPEWRAKTLLTKEPETIEWINGFNQRIPRGLCLGVRGKFENLRFSSLTITV